MQVLYIFPDISVNIEQTCIAPVANAVGQALFIYNQNQHGSTERGVRASSTSHKLFLPSVYLFILFMIFFLLFLMDIYPFYLLKHVLN